MDKWIVFLIFTLATLGYSACSRHRETQGGYERLDCRKALGRETQKPQAKWRFRRVLGVSCEPRLASGL